MRNNIRYWTIRFGNWIGKGDYVDLGDEAVAMAVYKDKLFITTKKYLLIFNGKVWKRERIKLDKYK